MSVRVGMNYACRIPTIIAYIRLRAVSGFSVFLLSRKKRRYLRNAVNIVSVVLSCKRLPYSGKLSRETTFANW